MATSENVDPALWNIMQNMKTSDFEPTTPVSGPPLSERRVAVVTTAALQREGDRPFSAHATDFRVIPKDAADSLTVGHISVNFDRSGFQRDYNVVFPIDRLEELAEQGEIGSVADYHYAFLGSSNPLKMEAAANRVAGLLKQDRVDAVLLTPV
jgi:D-proline reductase (dithiol) PrdB